jgi:hypothetical protein
LERNKEMHESFGRETRKKEALGRIRRRWENSVEMDMKEIREDAGWILLLQ